MNKTCIMNLEKIRVNLRKTEKQSEKSEIFGKNIREIIQKNIRKEYSGKILGKNIWEKI